MKKNSPNKLGFTLIETIISIAVIGVMSLAIYSGYVLLIKYTKEGQVKQNITLEGKKSGERIKALSYTKEFNIEENNRLKLSDEYEFNRNIDGEYYCKKYFNKDYKICDKKNGEYTEIITLNKTKTESGQNVNRPGGKYADSNDDDIKEKYDHDVSISISGDDNTEVEINDEENSSRIPINESDEYLDIYIYAKLNDNQKKVIIKDKEGNDLLEQDFGDETRDKDIEINLIINFKDYYIDGGVKDVHIMTYNNDTVPFNICLKKSNKFRVNVEACKGKVNIYSNRSIDKEEVGDLYDINIKIYKGTDEKKGECLFKSYLNQNINIFDNNNNSN